ncbi:YbaB/EbfC family nucleoid-associated protein [Plantactinospora sp. CA-294935]|uniref:YbaB/EbfC family nucleoid-associated protein n=1 Tax=Plantactinospora sp. CA-294935 TaxID=3240012 RepID=UPI003D9461F0
MTVDGEQVAELRARAERLTAQFRQVSSALDEVSARVRAVAVTATSADGSITATVGPEGRLQRLDLGPEVLDYGDARRLAEEIEATIAVAAEEAQRQVFDACRPYVSEESMAAYRNHDFDEAIRRMVERLPEEGSIR